MTDAWDVYRDVMGRPVTITEEQGRAIWHAFGVWQSVYLKEKGEMPQITAANLQKSCLLGRMLFGGRKPLPEAPPVVESAPAYWLADPDLCPKCRRDRSGPGGWLGVSVDMSTKIRVLNQCIEDWHQPRGIPQP